MNCQLNRWVRMNGQLSNDSSLVLRKELDRRLENAGQCFEWSDIKQDLKSLQEITIEDNGRTMVIRSESLGTCGKVFQAVGVAIPPTTREAT